MSALLQLAKECGAHITSAPMQQDGIAFFESELAAFALRIRAEALEEAAKVIPTSWLDPRLTGLGGMGQPPYSCADIERLLMGIGSAIRVLAQPAGDKT